MKGKKNSIGRKMKGKKISVVESPPTSENLSLLS